MSRENEAVRFFQSVTEGTDHHTTRVLEAVDANTGEELELEVEVHVVSKETLMGFLDSLPEEMLSDIATADDQDEAQEIAQEYAGGVSDETVREFKSILKESLQHEELIEDEMAAIVEQFSFDVLFDLGTEVVDISFENDGRVKDFYEPD